LHNIQQSIARALLYFLHIFVQANPIARNIRETRFQLKQHQKPLKLKERLKDFLFFS